MADGGACRGRGFELRFACLLRATTKETPPAIRATIRRSLPCQGIPSAIKAATSCIRNLLRLTPYLPLYPFDSSHRHRHSRQIAACPVIQTLFAGIAKLTQLFRSLRNTEQRLGRVSVAREVLVSLSAAPNKNHFARRPRFPRQKVLYASALRKA
jgi:hypothetical protein